MLDSLLHSAITNTAVQRHFPAGGVIFNEGDPGDAAYLVRAGEIRVTLQGNQINYLCPGTIFGEMALVDDRPRSATATAVTDCTLIPVDRSLFMKLVQDHPGFAIEVMGIMSARLRVMMAEEIKRHRLEQELEIGRRIQLSLLPERPPRVPGWEFGAFYQAARQVGGDLYDFIVTGDDPDHISVVIADVTGKGVPAALFMAVTRTLVRAETRTGRGPAATLQQANHLLRYENRTPLFLSACAATINVGTGQVTLASAGHEAPLWLQGDMGTVTKVNVQGMLLGAFREPHCQEQSITLTPNDALIFYTDGITEARNKAGGFFGEGRLQAAIVAARGQSATSMVEAIVTAVNDFTGTTIPQTDDLTVIVVKRVNL